MPPASLAGASGCWMRGAGGGVCPVCAPPPPHSYPECPLVPKSDEWAPFSLIPWHPCTGLPTARARCWRLQLTSGHGVCVLRWAPGVLPTHRYASPSAPRLLHGITSTPSVLVV